MQNEDDLRGLAKVMDFMRAISILFVVINIYWFCYQSFRQWGINIGVVDKILLNFQRTAGLFSNILYTKLFSVVFLALSCLGTKGVKEEKITWNKIYVFLTIGFILFFLNWWLLVLPLPLAANTALYIFTMTAGYLSLLAAGVWISRLLKNNLMDDVFNLENESFAQETRLIENEYSVNLRSRFYYKKKWNDGWINVVAIFRACIVVGNPGSGKSFCVVNQFIKQQIEKGFAMYLYDYKFPDLSEIAYNHLLNHSDGYKVKPKFYIINFDDPRKSHRCNPINPAFMTDISDAYEASYTIMLNLNRSWITKQGDFYNELNKTEDTTVQVKTVSEYKFLDRYGEIGEYIRLELKLLLRNKVCRKSLYSVTAIVLIFSLTISFSDIYDGGSRDFFVLYNYIIFGILFLSPLMSYEGNYIDGLMSRKESIYSLLRAKYILYSIALIIPFVLMIPGMVTGKVSVLECTAWIIFVPGAVYFCLFQLAVYNNKTLDLNAKMTGRQNVGTGLQNLIAGGAFGVPLLLFFVLNATVGKEVTPWILLVVGILFIATSRWWLRNVYHRFMKRRYKNMEGFHDSRQK